MGLRRWFPGSTETALPGPAREGASGPEASEPLTPAQLAEFREAWVELALAAERPGGAGHFRACTRNGNSWAGRSGFSEGRRGPAQRPPVRRADAGVQ
jgi:hypothetical protein